MNVYTRSKGWLMILTALALVGCGNQGAAPAKQQPQPQQQGDQVEIKTTPAERKPNPKQVSETNKPNYTVRAPQVQVAGNQGQESAEQQADSLANIMTRIPGVEHASVLIAGKMALVGLDLHPSITGSQIDSIKFSAKEAVERNGDGYRALVSADLDTVTRARTLIRDIQHGKPMTAISNEIADIVSRLIPEM
ncbi:hypothetical protein CIG75_08870 [Tumebacillus algifaecis]|uniref:Sporulation protein n=1 Tax=Tumebacillus algifaecis TaxID=1214604 RepID=A0A223D0A9_9BACL|nr:YhcN/YlaJ family sporulation lipoprotein [Tumebacillus algifaecis]ASS75078.1 hypothetical protein CIG75_08870 [Tumebacillus algifaecis]